MVNAGLVIGVAFLVVFAFIVLFGIYKSINIVREKEAVIVERLGKFKKTLTPGIEFIVPYLDWPKTYTHRYYIRYVDVCHV